MNNEKLVSMAKEGNKDAFNKLAFNNFGLVHSVARELIQNVKYEYEDIFQIGCIGLIKAVNNFDEKYNVKFSTYAVYKITGEIKMFLRDNSVNGIKFSRSLRTYIKNKDKNISLNKKVYKNNNKSILQDTVKSSINVEKIVIKKIEIEKLYSCIERLPDMEKNVIKLKLKGYKQVEIANMLGLLEKRVSRAKQRAIKNLKILMVMGR